MIEIYLKLVKIGKDSKGFIIQKKFLKLYNYESDIVYSFEINEKRITIKKTKHKLSDITKVEFVSTGGERFEIRF